LSDLVFLDFQDSIVDISLLAVDRLNTVRLRSTRHGVILAEFLIALPVGLVEATAIFIFTEIALFEPRSLVCGKFRSVRACGFQLSVVRGDVVIQTGKDGIGTDGFFCFCGGFGAIETWGRKGYKCYFFHGFYKLIQFDIIFEIEIPIAT
jgi:hypothetical protein